MVPFAQNRLEYDTWLILVNAVLHDFTIGTLLNISYCKILESTASEAITLAVGLDYLALSVHTPPGLSTGYEDLFIHLQDGVGMVKF